MKTKLTKEESNILIDLGIHTKDNNLEFSLDDILSIILKTINDYELNICINNDYCSAQYVLWDNNDNGDPVIIDFIGDELEYELIDTLYKLLVNCITNNYIKINDNRS